MTELADDDSDENDIALEEESEDIDDTDREDMLNIWLLNEENANELEDPPSD